MAKKITKALIPAAGFGTRFLPQTKAMPKEMLPVVDEPVIQYVVEEVVASGLETVIIITGSNKRAIEDHFDEPNEDLTQNLINSGKEEQLNELRKISTMADFVYIRQKGPYGNGTPVLSAESVIGDEPFAVLWGDEFIQADPPRLAQMIKAYEKYGGIIISGVRIESKQNLSRYGIADIEPMEGNVFKVKSIVEKPDPDEAPSNLAIVGAYILPPEIFDALRRVQPGKGGEVWLVDAINLLQKEGIPLYAVEVENGKYYDTGNKLEYLKTVIELARKHKEIGPEFEEYLKNLLSKA
jgi:UTP--glucose-1-phosphate uridylyltransferase